MLETPNVTQAIDKDNRSDGSPAEKYWEKKSRPSNREQIR